MTSETIRELKERVVLSGQSGGVAVSVGGTGAGDDQDNRWIDPIRDEHRTEQFAAIYGNRGGIRPKRRRLRMGGQYGQKEGGCK